MESKFSGNRLRLARLFHGISLQELGDAVSASRQYIQQLENESKVPNEEMQNALAFALKVKPDFFSSPDGNVVGEEQCHFRSLRATSSSVKSQAIAHGNILDKLAIYLDEVLDLPKVHFPKIENIRSFNDIESAAEQCRLQWGLGLKAPILSMVRTLERAGALITFFSGISEKLDAFSMQRKRPLIIRNPFKESVCRMRFDLAHECGHIVMHEGIVTGDAKTEAEANRFASALLLPRAAFLNEFRFLRNASRIPWQRIYELKVRWKVSNAAIIRRAHDLGLIDAIKYRNANIHLRKTGQSKEEINDDKIPLEEPESLKIAINILREDGDGMWPIIDRLNVAPDFLRKLLGDVEFDESDFLPKEDSNIVRFPFR